MEYQGVTKSQTQLSMHAIHPSIYTHGEKWIPRELCNTWSFLVVKSDYLEKKSLLERASSCLDLRLVNLCYLIKWGEKLNYHNQSPPEIPPLCLCTTLCFFLGVVSGINLGWSSKKQESSRKTSVSALLTMPKPLTVWITINCGKFWKRWEYQITWPASWETYM